MTSYRDRYAELYDLIYAEKPYAAEAAFVAGRLRAAPGSVKTVVELACGTGTMALLLAGHGFSVIGTDWSPSMLAQARAKKSSVDFQLQDMRELDVKGRPFDAIVCLFDSIGYLQDTEAIRTTLVRVREHLRPGGRFIFDFWHAAAMLKSHEAVRVRRWDTRLGKLVRISETSLRPMSSLADVDYTLFDPQPDGSYKHFHERQTNRYFLVEEMRALVNSAGLEPLHFFDGYREDRFITAETWHVVCEACAPV